MPPLRSEAAGGFSRFQIFGRVPESIRRNAAGLHVERLRENLADFSEKNIENLYQNRPDEPVTCYHTFHDLWKKILVKLVKFSRNRSIHAPSSRDLDTQETPEARIWPGMLVKFLERPSVIRALLREGHGATPRASVPSDVVSGPLIA